MWSFTWVIALSGALAAASTPVGREELKTALARYQAIKRLDVDFKQTKSLKDLNLTLNSEGHLNLIPPDHVQWKITKPQPLTVDLEQQKITIRSASGTETFSQSENPSEKDRKSFAMMLTWLKLDADAILQKYTVSKLKSRTFRFVTKDPGEPMLKSLEMELTEAGHVATLLFQEASDDEMRLVFARPKVIYRKAK